MRSLFKTSSLVLSAALLFACSSTAPPPPAVTGTVSSASLSSVSARASTGTFFSGSAGPSPDLRILISDKENSCSVSHFASATMLDIRIRHVAGTRTYALVDSVAKTPADGEAEADLNAVDGSCHDTVAAPATGGTVTIKTYEVNGTNKALSRVTGSVDATFAGGRIQGDFDAVLCDGPATGDATDAGPRSSVCSP